MPTLEDIAENSKIVIDTSFFGAINKKMSIPEIKQFIAFLDNCGKRIIVVPEVIKENEANPRNSKKGSQKLKGFINRGANQDIKDKYHKLISRLQFLKRMEKRLRRREEDFTPIPFYQSIFQMVCYLSDSFEIKLPENRTDESIVATAFFLAYCGSEKIAILSNDGDLVGLSYVLMRESKISLINKILENNQIRIYGNTKRSVNDCTIRWDSKSYCPERPRLSYQQQRTLRDLVSNPILF